MGATTFGAVGRGATAQEAFRNAREEAQWEHGHGGYSGTVAEKSSFTYVEVTDEVRGDRRLLNEKIDELTDNQFSDKWGPAGCIKLREGEYLFFGWASE
jgi:hypothetical protein